MEEMINLIVNNGIGIVCVGYMIYFQSTTLKDIQNNQEKTNLLLEKMLDRIDTSKKTK